MFKVTKYAKTSLSRIVIANPVTNYTAPFLLHNFHLKSAGLGAQILVLREI
jgi:hypothetical protein